MVPNTFHSTLMAGTAGALTVVFSLFTPVAVAQDEEPPPVYAELMPLAASSLLLDVTRTDAGRWVAVGERGHIVWSDDGMNWTQATQVPTRSTLTSVADHGNRLWAAGHDTVILFSGDGGLSWERQYFDPGRQQGIMDIYFLDQDRGFALGAYGLMLVTGDAGATWDDHYVSDEEWHLNALEDLGDGQLVIAGEAGLNYVSQDEGETWEVIEMPYPGSMFGVTPANDCLLVFGLRGNVQESCDGGFAWAELDTPTQATLSAGVSAGDLTVLAGNSGAILKRSGGGEFELVSHSSGVDFAGILPLEDGRFLLVGEDGVHWYPEPEAR